MREQLSCPACAGHRVHTFFRLEGVPVHQNLLMPTPEAARGCERGDIVLGFCPACGFISNLAFDPGLLKYSPQYENSQSFSPLFRSYMERLAADINNRVRFLQDHGREPGDRMFRNKEVAYKYKMSSMQAALGLAQLERIEELIARKREIFAWYRRELADVNCVTLNYEAPDTKNTYWMVTPIIDEALGLEKERLMELMAEKRIDCRPFFHPLSSLLAYQDVQQAQRARERNHVSYRISPYGINLPSSLNMTEEKVAYVCDTLKGILHRKAE
jgi:hypothetical protein